MAQAELDILLNKLSGRLTGDSKFYTTHRHGKTVVSNYPLHRDPKKVTAQQQAQSDAFGKAVKLCKAENEQTFPLNHFYYDDQLGKVYTSLFY